MTTLITELFSGFDSTITGMAEGIKNAFMNLIYEDPTAETLVVSDFAKFGFIMIGLGMAIGIVYAIMRKIRG